MLSDLECVRRQHTVPVETAFKVTASRTAVRQEPVSNGNGRATRKKEHTPFNTRRALRLLTLLPGHRQHAESESRNHFAAIDRHQRLEDPRIDIL